MIHQKRQGSQEAIAQQAGISEAEIIRQALDDSYKKPQSMTAPSINTQ